MGPIGCPHPEGSPGGHQHGGQRGRVRGQIREAGRQSQGALNPKVLRNVFARALNCSSLGPAWSELSTSPKAILLLDRLAGRHFTCRVGPSPSVLTEATLAPDLGHGPFWEGWAGPGPSQRHVGNSLIDPEPRVLTSVTTVAFSRGGVDNITFRLTSNWRH